MQLTAKQNEYIRNATHRWNFKVGAVRSGKSFVDVAYSIPNRIRERVGLSGLSFILGVSQSTIERNVLHPMREIYTDRLVGNIRGNNTARIFGEDVYCLGAERISQVGKIQGASIKYLYGDEIAKWNEDVFDFIPSRLDKSYSCFDGACNPEYPSHWLKKFIDREDIDSYVQHYTIFDNPNLPPDVVNSMCAEYEGTIYYDRLILGLWVKAEGLVYPNYDNTVPTRDRFYSRYVVSMDYGTMNPTAAILWGLGADLTWYAVKEYYYSGREDIPLTDEQHYANIERLVEGIPVRSPLEKITLIVDPSAASFIAVANKHKRFKVRKADNDVINGVRTTAVMLADKRLMFNDCCKNTIQEFGEYSWDDKTVEDAVIKDNDHAMDAVRYFVMTEKIWKDRSRDRYGDLSGLLG